MRIAECAEALLGRHGHDEDEDVDDEDPNDAQPVIHCSTTGRKQRGRAAPDRLAKQPSATSRWVPWAWLLWRAVQGDSWAWSPATPADCDRRMRLRTVVLHAGSGPCDGPPATLGVLASLKRSARGPHALAVGLAVA